MTYDIKSEDMDKRALIQQYLNGRLNSAQIADFTRQLKDPEFCNILSEEREKAEKQRATCLAAATMSKVAEAQPISEKEQESLIDLYLCGDMDSETESRFLSHIKTDKGLRKQVQLVANIVKGALEEQRQSDLEFGCAMKNLTRDRLEQIVGPRRNAVSRSAALRTQEFDRPEMPEMPVHGAEPSRSDMPLYKASYPSQDEKYMEYCLYDRSFNSFDSLESSAGLEPTKDVGADIYDMFKPNYAAYGIHTDDTDKSALSAYKSLNVIKAAFDKLSNSSDTHKILAVGKDLAVEYLHIGMVDKFKEILNDLRLVAAHSSSKDDDTLKRDIRLLLALSETI